VRSARFVATLGPVTTWPVQSPYSATISDHGLNVRGWLGVVLRCASGVFGVGAAGVEASLCRSQLGLGEQAREAGVQHESFDAFVEAGEAPELVEFGLGGGGADVAASGLDPAYSRQHLPQPCRGEVQVTFTAMAQLHHRLVKLSVEDRWGLVVRGGGPGSGAAPVQAWPDPFEIVVVDGVVNRGVGAHPRGDLGLDRSLSVLWNASGSTSSMTRIRVGALSVTTSVGRP